MILSWILKINLAKRPYTDILRRDTAKILCRASRRYFAPVLHRQDPLQRSCADPATDYMCTKILPRDPTKRSCPEILRTDLVKRSFKRILSRHPSRGSCAKIQQKQRCLACVLLEILPKGLAQDLQRFPSQRSSRGCGILAGDPTRRSYPYILRRGLVKILILKRERPCVGPAKISWQHLVQDAPCRSQTKRV